MKQKITLLLLLTMLVTVIAGCGKKAETETETETTTETTEVTTTGLSARNFKAAEYVTLGNYKGFEVEAAALEAVTDEDVENYISYILSYYTEEVEITDRAAQTGDIVHVLSVGKTLDGEEFDNSGETGYDVEIGGTGYIEGYAEGLEGASIGDVVELNLTFPADYSATELAGQEAIFTLTVESIKQSVIAELNDELIVRMDTENGSDYKTVDGFRTGVRTMLEEYAQSSYDNTVAAAVLDQISAEATFQELPADLLTYYRDSITSYYTSEAAYYGADLETYMSTNFGITMDVFNTEIETMAATSAKEELICQLIAELEKITVSDEDMDARLAEDVKAAGLTTKEEYLGTTDIEDYRAYLVKLDVLQFLIKNAVVVEPVVEETTTEETTTEETTTEETTTEETTTEETTTDGN
jgi:trigger factor